MEFNKFLAEVRTGGYRVCAEAIRASKAKIATEKLFISFLKKDGVVFKNSDGFLCVREGFVMDDEYVSGLIGRRYRYVSRPTPDRTKTFISLLQQLPTHTAYINGTQKRVVLLEDIINQMN